MTITSKAATNDRNFGTSAPCCGAVPEEELPSSVRCGRLTTFKLSCSWLAFRFFFEVFTVSASDPLLPASRSHALVDGVFWGGGGQWWSQRRNEFVGGKETVVLRSSDGETPSAA